MSHSPNRLLLMNSQNHPRKRTQRPVVVEATFGPVLPLTPTKVVRISTDADGQYVASLGGASQAETQIESILNLVDGIYQFESGILLRCTNRSFQADPATDPYTASDPEDLLTQFSNHWNANFPNSGANQRSIAHLFTGRNLDGQVIGIASLGVACRFADSAYGLSQQFPLASSNITAQTIILTAHEIGHNFAAQHTNETSTENPPDLDRPCENTIMEAGIGDGSSFCPYSRSQITGFANAFSSCLTDTAVPPPSFPDCVATPISSGLAINGNLSAGDCRSPSRGVEFFADRYSFSGTAGQRISITMNSGGGGSGSVSLFDRSRWVLRNSER